MAAYVIAEVDVTDQALYEEYRKLVPETIDKYGGRFLVRGGAIESREGGWQPKRLVVIEFASMEQARAWYESSEYTPLRKVREAAASTRLAFVEGAS